MCCKFFTMSTSAKKTKKRQVDGVVDSFDLSLSINVWCCDMTWCCAHTHDHSRFVQVDRCRPLDVRWRSNLHPTGTFFESPRFLILRCFVWLVWCVLNFDISTCSNVGICFSVLKLWITNYELWSSTSWTQKINHWITHDAVIQLQLQIVIL